MKNIALVLTCLAGFAIGGPMAAAETAHVSSPDGDIAVSVEISDLGVPTYAVMFGEEEVVAPSPLGLRFVAHHDLHQNFVLDGIKTARADETWEMPWGENRVVRDHHNEMVVTFKSAEGPKRRFDVRFRVFDDGVGFRYEVPRQPGAKDIVIAEEMTGFRLPENSTAWWIPSRGWNRYEYIYNETPVGEVSLAHTPMTLRTPSGTHISVHEAALVDYSGMSLKQNRPGLFKADLSPWSTGGLVRKTGAFTTPWRTLQIAEDAKGLLNSNLILNLNEPNKLGDVSWVEPGKYVGIWWAMHIRDRSWGNDFIHGATTEETKRYMDFAAEHGFAGVLVEGWNIGWDGDWFHNGALFNFTKSYDDFDIEELSRYGAEKGVRLIGHHETSGDVTNYENQLADAFDLYERMGVAQVKTGYVADGGELKWTDEQGVDHYEWHDGQFSVRHHLKVIKEAAKRHISINPHEPIKDTGLRRTYPNWIAREGARGQEYNAWAIPPNPPSHTAILPYTRMLSGPMDFTPGIFDLRPSERPPVREDMARNSTDSRIETTLAKQLALYVVLYSPIQMAADLPENYEKNMEAFQFIKDVPTDWEKSIGLAGEIGEYVVFVRQRRDGQDWFLGALTNEEARDIRISLEFLDDGRTYRAEIYRDGDDADYDVNPASIVVEEMQVNAGSELAVSMAPGGGTAIRFVPLDQ